MDLATLKNQSAANICPPKSYSAKSTVLAGFLVGVFAISVQAFDYNGFTSGMNWDDAVTIANNNGIELQQISPDKEILLQTTSPHWGLSFCKGHLSELEYDLAGGVDSFIRAVANETLRRGEGRYGADSNETSAGQFNRIEVFWIEAQDIYAITLNSINGNFQPRVTYRSIAHYCKP